MRNYFNEYKLNEYNPVTLLLISLAESIGGSLASEFGTRSGSTKVGTGGLVITIVGFLIVPIFVKKQRKMFWTKKGLLIMLISIIINLPFAIISIKNKGSFFWKYRKATFCSVIIYEKNKGL